MKKNCGALFFLILISFPYNFHAKDSQTSEESQISFENKTAIEKQSSIEEQSASGEQSSIGEQSPSEEPSSLESNTDEDHFETQKKISLKKTFFDLRLRPELGLLSGSIKEYVIDPLCLNTNNVESLLDWQLIASPYIGIDASLTLFRYGYLSLNGKLGISNSNGVIEDYDWLNSVAGDGTYIAWLSEPATELTNYSHHINILQNYYDFSIFAGGNIYLPQSITITPFLGFYYDFIEMDAQDGYTQYKWDNWEKIDMSGRGIKYKQEANAFMLGLNVIVNTLPLFTFESSYRISPKLFVINDIDYHYNRNLVFYDYMESAFAFETKQNVFFKLAQKKSSNVDNSLGLSFFLHYVKYTGGRTSQAYMNSSGVIIANTLTKNIGYAGTSRFLWSLSLVYQMRIR